MKRQTPYHISTMHFKLGNTEAVLSFSFAATISLMLILCDEKTVLISLFSSFFHEGGHLLAMLSFSHLPSKIIFGAFGIRIEEKKGSVISYKKEIIIALSGILANFFLFICGLFFYYVYNIHWGLMLSAVNIIIGLFNILPVASLDFGRALSCFFSLYYSEEKSEAALSIISKITAVAIFIFCLFYTVVYGPNISLIAVSVYLIFITLINKGDYNDN